MYNVQLKSSGFTLIELLVVIGIIAAMVALLLPQLSGFNRSQNLKSAALGLQTALRQTQNNAISGVKCNSSTASANWYLKFIDSTHYKVETTCTGSGVGAGTPTPTPPISTTFTLPSNVNISSVKFDACSGNLSPITNSGVSFTNIAGLISFLSGDAGCMDNNFTKKIIITLQLTSDASQTTQVTVEKGGSIYLNNQ